MSDQKTYLFILYLPKYLPVEIIYGKGKAMGIEEEEKALLVTAKEDMTPKDIEKLVLKAKLKGMKTSVRKRGVVATFRKKQERIAAEKSLREIEEVSTKLNFSPISRVEIVPYLMKHLEEKQNITSMFSTENLQQEIIQLTFHTIGDKDTEATYLELWGTLAVGRSFGSLHVIGLRRSDVSRKYFGESSRGQGNSLENTPSAENANSDAEEDEQVLDLGILHNEVRNQIQQGALMSVDYVLMTITASLLAGVALVANNTVVVVASMLVSPLMGPILATVFGYIISDYNMLWISLSSEIVALFVCIASGFIVGVAFSPWGDILNWPNNEMASRGTTNGLLIGLGIAIPSGVGVALGVLGGNTSSLVGVAISASLLPPAVNCGICWAYAAFGPSLVLSSPHGIHPEVDRMHFVRLGGISFSLTLLNIGCIFVFAYLTFKAKIHLNYPGKTPYWDFLENEFEEDTVVEGGEKDNDKDKRAIELDDIKDLPVRFHSARHSDVGPPRKKTHLRSRSKSQYLDPSELQRKWLNRKNSSTEARDIRPFLGGGQFQTMILRNPMNALTTADVRKSVRIMDNLGGKRHSLVSVPQRVLQDAREEARTTRMTMRKRNKKKGKYALGKSLAGLFTAPAADADEKNV